MFQQAQFFATIAGIVLGVIAIIGGAIATELAGPLTRWIQSRSGYGDPQQSKEVRTFALRLASSKRKVRLAMVERLGDLRDPTAVPALLKAIHKHKSDGPFLETVVRTLAILGDERALSTLRELTHGRHRSLMQEARNAVAMIGPKTTLLRPSDRLQDQGNELLRPTHVQVETDKNLLLRPGSNRQNAQPG